MAKKKPTLRYFARFTEDFGYLRAVVRYDTTRKYILTPMVISQDQIKRLDTSGHIHPITNDKDIRIDGQLREFTGYVWQTVKPLIESGEFSTIPSEKLTSAIFRTKEEEETKRYKRLEAKAEEHFQRKAEEAKARGHELHSLSVEEFIKLTKELKERLTPEEYAALWQHPGKKGGDNGKR